jgi:uncharacterized integral membrane protein
VSDIEGGPAGPAEEEPRGAGDDAATPVTQQVGRIAIVVIAVIFLVFAFANAQHVDFSWLVGETQVVRQGGERVGGGVPLIVLLIVAFLAGAAVATLVAWQRARHRRTR